MGRIWLFLYNYELIIQQRLFYINDKANLHKIVKLILNVFPQARSTFVKIKQKRKDSKINNLKDIHKKKQYKTIGILNDARKK